MSNRLAYSAAFSVRNALDHYPHVLLIAPSACAWFALIGLHRSERPAICSAAGTLRPNMEAVGSVAVMITSACLMTLAMMVPLILGSARHVAVRSFRYRRYRALAAFLAGFVGFWVPVLTCGTLLIGLVVSRLPATIHPALAICVLMAWHCSPAKEKALQACHRTVPLAPHGLAADFACLRFGWRQGWSCGMNCWALMLALGLISSALVPMAIATAFAVRERYRGDPLRKPVLKIRAYIRAAAHRIPHRLVAVPTS